MKIYGYVGELVAKVKTKGISLNIVKENIELNGIIENKSNRRIDIEILLGNNREKYLLAEKRLKQDEIFDMKGLNLLLNLNEIKKLKKDEKQYIYIVEKSTEKILEKIVI